jgi:hypothetical protein
MIKAQGQSQQIDGTKISALVISERWPFFSSYVSPICLQ